MVVDPNDPTIPMDAVAARAGKLAHWYVYWAVLSPKPIQDMLYSPNTGAFLRGLAKQFALPEDMVPKLAFTVVQVAIGEIELANLASVLSSELKLPNDKAQRVAKEIEKELFVPYMLEWNKWLAQLKKEAEENRARAAKKGVQNVVDLKNPSTRPASAAKKSRI